MRLSIEIEMPDALSAGQLVVIDLHEMRATIYEKSQIGASFARALTITEADILHITTSTPRPSYFTTDERDEILGMSEAERRRRERARQRVIDSGTAEQEARISGSGIVSVADVISRSRANIPMTANELRDALGINPTGHWRLTESEGGDDSQLPFDPLSGPEQQGESAPLFD
jgi:hypothetical protein